MTYDPHHVPPAHAHHEEPVRESTGLTGYAIVKYGFILLITIVVLYFIARYIIPLLTR
ncbi:MAG TPA: hypothetical protein VM638_05725 [Actinomycetota bacterium]|nr:hypothetical protein [Actinomycetota bacterium]